MEQLVQKLGSGAVKVVDVPMPQCGPGMVLVRNHYSVISGGTEGATARSARKSLLGKALERPEQVKKVLEVVRRQGLTVAYRAVTKKLESYSPCGYSSAGVVLEVGQGVRGVSPGDRVACAGVGYASHAEVVSVPINLVVKLADDADLKFAAFNSLGAIALQGIRKADLRLGESCVVLGLGLIGQLTLKMLTASGVRVIGLDVDPRAIEETKRDGFPSFSTGAPGVEEQVEALTGTFGADAVIITAGTDSLEPINLAGRLSRKQGRVVVVGAVPTGFDREEYYLKEIELVLSCSYGPGRYDFQYEEQGIDYPIGHVRWTERRNMEAFQQLLHERRIDIARLVSHEFPLSKAPEAYDLIAERKEPYTGIVIQYDVDKPSAAAMRASVPSPDGPQPTVGISFIGAGSYAQSHLLPNIKVQDSVQLRSVLTNTGATSKRVQERFGFEAAVADEAAILGDPGCNTVFIATRHDTHAAYVVKCLEAGKNVFVEKPLCLVEDDLLRIANAAGRSGGRLMVGFNRRFAPATARARSFLGGKARAMTMRVNAGAIDAGSWIQDLKVGGGRLIGEACHFVDLMTFMAGSAPVEVHAVADPANGMNDVACISIRFANGAVGQIAYFSNGPISMVKERFEGFNNGLSAVIEDFKILELYSAKGREVSKSVGADKGQAAMVSNFVASIQRGDASPVALKEVLSVSAASIAIEESIRAGSPVRVLEW